MAKSLQQIIGYKNLTGIITSKPGGVPTAQLPPAFTSFTKPVEGDSGEYTKVEGNRRTARLVHYGAPSMRRELKGVSTVKVGLMHTFEHIVHNSAVLNQLRQFDNPAVQRRGEAVVAIETANFIRLFSNLRISAIYSALSQGAIYFDAGGNLMPTAGGAKITIDYGVPAANKTNCNDIFAASWATAGTDIIGDITSLKIEAVKKTGYPLVHAFYGKNILGHLLANTAIQALIAGNPGHAATFLMQEIPAGFLGLQWHPIYEAFYEDNDGNTNEWFDADNITFTPEPSPEWWEVLEGSMEVPTDIGGITANANDALGTLDTIYGMFSYAQILNDPVGIKHMAGDTFLPVLKVPSAIYIAHTTPP